MPRRFSTAIDIAAPPSRVWPVMRDVERWHEWTPSIRSIERLDGGPFAPGSRARVRQPKLPPAVWQVTDLSENRSFTWVSRAPGLLVTGVHAIEATPSGSRVILSIAYGGLMGGLLAWLTRGLNQRYIDLEAAGLKRRCEETAG